MRIRPAFLILALYFLGPVPVTSSDDPAAVVNQFYSLIDAGRIKDASQLLPIPTDDRERKTLDNTLKDIARRLKQLGGLKTVIIYDQHITDENAELTIRIIGGQKKGELQRTHLVMDRGGWKVNLMRLQQLIWEEAAISNLQIICKAQILHSVTKGRGKFTTLETLGAEGFIDEQLASGEKEGYIFVTEPVNPEGEPPMFDVTAKPKNTGFYGAGNRSFGSNETMLVYEAKGAIELRGSLKDRVPEGARQIK